MAHTLSIRKLRSAEFRQLDDLLETSLNARQRRRAESILLYAAGLKVFEIAEVLKAHSHTIYADLHAFDQYGVEAVKQFDSPGAPQRIKDDQIAEIVHLAEIPPYELGLPYGRWSLSKFRGYLIKRRVVKSISREHLRRLLKKGAYPFVASNAKS
jgi:transposase